MRGLHKNQQKILEYLLSRSEGATLEELSSHLGITKTATKEHLLRLDGLGYIRYQDIRGFVGRPKRRYFLSKEGQEAFPRQYSWLSNSLLKLLTKNFGDVVVGDLMEQLAIDVVNSMKNIFEHTTSPKERITAINKALNNLGYRSVIRQRDLRKGAVLEATNCVYHTVAKEHPELCRFDIQFIKHASGGMDVKLEKCIARGDSVCRFCLKNNSKSEN